MRALTAIFLLCSGALGVFAHEGGESFLDLRGSGNHLTGAWHVSVRDLEWFCGLDDDFDNEVTWGEIRKAFGKLEDALQQSIIIRDRDRSVPVKLVDLQVEQRRGGVFLSLQWQARASTSETLSVSSRFLLDMDPGRRLLVTFRSPHGEQTFCLTKAAPTALLKNQFGGSFINFVRQGISHILDGTDHILFLLAMLLPLLGSAANGKSVFRRVFALVTAFTAAHSLTLALGFAGWLVLPSKFVETAIALSVAAAALNNIRPIWADQNVRMAFLFGLIHGLGFASSLAELGLGSNSLLATLAGFNLGVEFGQALIVAAFMLVFWNFRNSRFYFAGCLRCGSVLIVLVALGWASERAFSFAPFTLLATLVSP